MNMDKGSRNLRRSRFPRSRNFVGKTKFLWPRGKELNWFKSYLENRFQYCKINGKVSKTEAVTCGAPQGSCLGPLFFLVFTNNLPNCFEKSDVSMYAADTCSYYSFDSVDAMKQAIDADLTALKAWLESNKLSLNVAKTETMIIGTETENMVVGHKRQTNRIHGPLEVKINGGQAKRVKKVKYLGVTVDENLTWNEQCKNLNGKIKNALSSLQKLKNILPQTKLDRVYKALLETHLRYSDELWGCLLNTKLDHPLRLQTTARTLIESSKLKDGGSCNWLLVPNLIIFDRTVMIYYMMNVLCPDNLRGRLVTRS